MIVKARLIAPLLMTIILRLLRTTTQNIFRHGLISLAAILVMTLLVLLLNGLLFTGFAQSAALRLINERLDLALNFTVKASTADVQEITKALRQNFPGIRAIKFVSAEDAFQNFLKNFQTVNGPLSDWLASHATTSPLPATLVISADAALHQPILNYLTASRYALLFDLDNPATGALATTTTTKILAFENTVRNLSLAAIIMFGSLAALIIIAVLRLTILSRQMEITIMRLVGATRAFIRLPFVLEGVFFAMIASVLGSLTFLFTLSRLDLSIFSGSLYGSLGEFLTNALKNYGNNFPLLLGWQILVAVLIGVTASYLATRKYLGRELVLN